MKRKKSHSSNSWLKKKLTPVNIAILVILLVFVISAVQVLRIEIGYMQASAVYDEIASSTKSINMTIFSNDGTAITASATTAVTSTETEESEAESETTEVTYTYSITIPDFEYLSSVNSDVVGWIQIPGTAVNYPMVQGTDNDYYLTHLYTGATSSNGAIFMDSGTTEQLKDKNAIIFGHNMKDGSMFATLNNYTASSSYYSLHPYIVVTDVSGTRYIYDIFAVYTVDSADEEASNSVYLHGFGADSVYADYLEYVKSLSVYDTGISVDQDDYIITLSTCASANSSVRTIVQAVRR